MWLGSVEGEEEERNCGGKGSSSHAVDGCWTSKICLSRLQHGTVRGEGHGYIQKDRQVSKQDKRARVKEFLYANLKGFFCESKVHIRRKKKRNCPGKREESGKSRPSRRRIQTIPLVHKDLALGASYGS